MKSSLKELPLVRWASRFRSGNLSVAGIARETLCHGPLSADAGPVSVSLTFSGGPVPTLASASLQGVVLDTEDHAVAEALGDLVDGLADVKVSGELLPDGRLDVKFGFGVSVVLDGMHCLSFEGRTVGEPGGLCLAEPLELDFSGCSVRISHERVGLLSRLAAVRIQAVRLHPDGSVSFDSGGSRLVRTGLQRAGEHFSSFLKRSPRLRPFLAKA